MNSTFATVKFRENLVNRFWAVTLSHRDTNVGQLGQMLPTDLTDEQLMTHLRGLKQLMGLEEVYFLQTCNRLLFVAVEAVPTQLSKKELAKQFFTAFNQHASKENTEFFIKTARTFTGIEVANHLFSVTSSIHSLVVGEREILGQVRKAYQNCKEASLTGDGIRMLIDVAVKTAKQVFTHTKIGDNAVSVVSLAVRSLLKQTNGKTGKVLFIGAGQTNTIAAKMLQKSGFSDIVVFNRSIKNAERLAKLVNGEAKSLAELKTYQEDFDVIISCTGSNDLMLTTGQYLKMTANAPTKQRFLVDLAVPADLDRNLANIPQVHYLNIEQLREQAKSNMALRQKEVIAARHIIDENRNAFMLKCRRRNIEKSLSIIPEKVKAIKGRAYNQVFQKEISQLDEDSRATLDKIVNYFEKKYIGIPVSVAREALDKELAQD